MLHVIVALYILGAIVGVAAAMFVNHYRLVTGLLFFGPFVRFLLFFSLLMLVLLSTYYAAANLEQTGANAATVRILWGIFNNLVGFVAFSGWLVSFLQVLRGFEGRGLAPASKMLLTVLIGGVFCSYMVGLGLAILGGAGSWLRWSRDLYNLAVPVVIIGAMAGLLRRVGRAAFDIPVRSVRAFLLLYLSAYAFALILPVIFSRSGLLVLAFVLPATNTLPFVWVRRFLLRETGMAPSAVPESASVDVIAERHHLTSREREIVDHVLRGCSNAEIGAALFISSGTVKNHVYSIYRKLGVKSRGQLHRLVRESVMGVRRPRSEPESRDRAPDG
jgi:DNA-binding CsgD family transcriptional regulator